MTIQESLQTLGFNEKQTAIYLALLQLGRTSVHPIADKAGIKRPTAYVILDELIARGAVVRVPRVRKKLYSAVSPSVLFGSAEEKMHQAKEILPELLALTKGSESKVNVVYFEGVRGIKEVMEYKREEDYGKETVGFYATAKNVPQELAEYFDTWNTKRIKKKITSRIIVPDDPSLKDYRKSDTKYGYITKKVPTIEYSSQIAIDVGVNVVRIHDYKNLQGIAIENADIAKTFREIFELVWKKY